MGIGCEIFDVLTVLPDKMYHFIPLGHSNVFRPLPLPMGAFSKRRERHSPKKIYEFCAKGAEKLQEKLLCEPFDAVVSVHVFASLVMTEVRRAFGNRIPSYFVATDYACSPGVEEIVADGYFIPHRMLFGDFVRARIAANKLYATGIPILRRFYAPVEKKEARRRLGLDEGKRIVLVSGGKMGKGHLEKHALELSNSLPDGTDLVVLCGMNEELLRDLERFQSPRLRVVGFTPEVDLYMSAADVYLTKPGGMMTTEAILKGLPMVFVDAVRGCETHNYEFLMRHGLAEGGKSWSAAIEQVLKLLANPEAAEEMRRKMKTFLSGESAAEQICRWVAKN